MRGLRTPDGIQRALNKMSYHFASSAWSPRVVLRERTAHCLEGAVFAAAALRVLGFPPLVVDLQAAQDADHVIAVYRRHAHWGAIAKSNVFGLRGREPVYRTVRELVMSYFDDYINLRGNRTLRAYSRPVGLVRFDRTHPGWMTSAADVWFIAEHLVAVPHQGLLTRGMIRNLTPFRGHSIPHAGGGDVRPR
jgi:hypothetical protein